MSNLGPLLPKEIADGYAIQALSKGIADENQQRRAFKCIVEELCGTYGMTFSPESDRLTSFAEGKRHIGRLLIGIATINLGAVKAADERIEKRSVTKPTKGTPHGR